MFLNAQYKKKDIALAKASYSSSYGEGIISYNPYKFARFILHFLLLISFIISLNFSLSSISYLNNIS